MLAVTKLMPVDTDQVTLNKLLKKSSHLKYDIASRKWKTEGNNLPIHQNSPLLEYFVIVIAPNTNKKLKSILCVLYMNIYRCV